MIDEIPEEFSDEEKWFKFFSIHSLIVLAAGLGIAAGLAKLISLIYTAAFVPVMLMGAVVTIIIVIFTMVPRSDTEWLRGGGQSYAKYFTKRILRKMNKRLYVLGYGRY